MSLTNTKSQSASIPLGATDGKIIAVSLPQDCLRACGLVVARRKYRLSDAEIASHLSGKESFGVRAPKFGARVSWVDFDIDHGNGNFHDERITKLIRIFGEKNLLLQYREASGNFSLLGRCLPLWENQHQAAFREILEMSGLKVGKGVIEIFPDVGRGRRLPLGD